MINDDRDYSIDDDDSNNGDDLLGGGYAASAGADKSGLMTLIGKQVGGNESSWSSTHIVDIRYFF